MSLEEIYLIDLNKKLDKLIEINSRIYKVLSDQIDEGKAIYMNGTLSATNFTVIDLISGRTSGTDVGGTPGHPVKGYMIKNTGTTNLLFAHNVTFQPQLDLNVTLDALKSSPIFSTLIPGESESSNYNIKCIRSVHLIASSGTPTYKIKMIW